MARQKIDRHRAEGGDFSLDTPFYRHRCEGLEETTSQESGERIKAAQSDRSAMKAAQTLAFACTNSFASASQNDCYFLPVRGGSSEERSGKKIRSRRKIT